MFIEHLPADATSAYHRSRHPNDYWFGVPEQFAAAILHAVQSGNWQRGGGKGKRPAMFEPAKPKKAVVRSGPRFTVDTIRDELAARRQRAQPRQERGA